MQLKPILLIIAIVTFSSMVHANEHDQFLKAEKYLAKRQYSRFINVLPNLQAHPLLPYLESQWIKTQFHKKPVEQINEFMNVHSGTPFASQLQRSWLKYLGKKKEWSLFLEHYQPTQNLTIRCYLVRAFKAQGYASASLEEGNALWSLGKSLPKACDPFLAQWKKDGLLTSERYWQRFVKSVENRQYKLARYLQKKLPNKLKKQAGLVRSIWRQPKDLFRKKDAAKLPVEARAILVTRALKRFPELAQKASLETLIADFSDAAHKQAQYERFTAFAKTPSADTFYHYKEAADNGLLDDELVNHFLNGAVQNAQWPTYAYLYKVAPQHIQQEPKWSYWKGRALISMGAPTPNAAPYYQIASKERDYYGFMASQALQIPAAMNHNPTHVSGDVILQTKANPAIQRSLAFLELNRITSARREWQHAFDHLDQDSRRAMALIAGRYEWADRAIFTLAQLKDWHDLQLRFPLAHAQHFSQAAQRTQLPMDWIYGIARQESAFQFDARSPAGAMGLMQLMPRTAQSVSKRNRLRYSKKSLLKPQYNLDLGSRYMKQLLNRYDGNRVLATAAYNAGPGNVNRWLRRFEGPMDLWIENIPFKETREYVQRVLAYTTIYSYRRGELQPIMDNVTLASWAHSAEDTLQISKNETQQPPKG